MPDQTDLWISAGDWRRYEHYIFGTLQRRFPGAQVVPNAQITGLKSGRARQIDTLVELALGGCNIKIAFDCKCYGRKVNVKDVESFLGMLDDVRVSQGVLVTTRGYSKAAYRRAQREPRDIDLQILSPDRLSDYQFIGCLWLWKGPVAAIVEPPCGWVVDFENTGGWCQFSMYPLGHNRESAMKMCPFVYGNIILKTEGEPTMEAIAERHEREVIERLPTARFERLPTSPSGIEGAHSRTLLRVGYIDPSYGGPEYSLYVDTPKGVLLLVLLCPVGRESIYVPALEWIGRGAVTMNRDDEGNPPLAPNQTRVVGCTLFSPGMRQRISESPDRRIQVVD